MVSGFFTSPFDHVRMSPAVARLMVSRLLSFTSNTCCSSKSSRNELLEASWLRGVFLVGTALRPRQVDTERFRRAEGVLVELANLDLLTGLVHDADVEAE